MIVTTTKIALKVARSKTARKAALQAAKLIKENVDLDVTARSVTIGQHTYSLERTRNSALPHSAPADDPFS
jgi:hypothetical protein